MKIGIITFHRAHNYGAVLQAYALRKYLQNLGHEAEFIDYWPKYHRHYHMFPIQEKQTTIIGFLRAIKYSLRNPFLYILRFSRFRSFMKSHLGLSAILGKDLPIEKFDLNKDAIVYGSDQIWRKYNYPDFKGFDRVYFGYTGEQETTKISYAASMGILQKSPEDIQWLVENCKNLDEISVRERDLQEALIPHIPKEIQLVTDPVFLLSHQEWADLSNSRPSTKKYVLLYQLSSCQSAVNLAERISHEQNLEIIEIRGVIDPRLSSKRYKQTAGPIQFLELIRDAQFVISTSYHGTLFSILFERNFVATGMGKNSSRIKTILESINLADHYIEEIPSTFNINQIDYKQIRGRIDDLRKSSFTYLNNATTKAFKREKH